MKIKNKLYVFDFDGTLMQSPEQEEGKEMYERIVGKKYPHKGWWSKPESLHAEFDIQPNQSVLEYYNKANADECADILLMTNRLKRLEPQMLIHLNKHNLSFENKYFGDSVDGRQTKPSRLALYLAKLRADGHKISEVIVLDDMDEQINHYLEMREDWSAWGSDIKLTILQVNGDGTITEK